MVIIMYSVKKKMKVKLFKDKEVAVVEQKVNSFIHHLTEKGCIIKDIRIATNGDGESVLVVYEEKGREYSLKDEYKIEFSKNARYN
jgi:hypothetical protein